MRVFPELRARMRSFCRNTAGNLAVILALSAIPLTLAMGAGVDYARGLVVHSNMSDALDAAGLAVGAATTKPTSCSSASTDTAASNSACQPLQAIAQQYFNANFKLDSSNSTLPTIGISIANEAVTLTANYPVTTTFLFAADRLLNSTALDTMNINASTTVVWGQTKLWVSLVLDNSGSMSDSDKDGSKMDALKAASASLLTTLQNASNTAGDVQVAIVPFAREVNVGTNNAGATNRGATWLSWTLWEMAGEANGTVITTTTGIANPAGGTASPATIEFAAWGPGDPCPFTNDTTDWRGRVTINTQSPFGYYCTSGSANNSSNVDTIPSSGGTKGWICPSEDAGAYNPDRHDHYYNGCWTSVKDGTNTSRVSNGSSASCNGFTNSCTCSGSNSSRHCDVQRWIHAWVLNAHTTWSGCITDRTQDYDIQNTTPSGATTGMAADNPSDNTCLAATVTTLGYDWGTLSTQVTNMQPGGSTNQAIGVVNGWQALTPGDPYGAPAIPANTTRYIIMLSDGLNTEDRWYGDGSTLGTADDTSIDTRENDACTAAKTDHVVIYTLYLDISKTPGNSTPLQNCATNKTDYYFDLTATSQVATAFANIASQITNLRVSK